MAGTRDYDISPDLVENVVDEIFNAALQSERAMAYVNICRQVTNVKKTGTYLTLGALGPAEDKIEADNYHFDRIRQGNKTQLTVVTRGKGVEASMEALDDDLSTTVEQSFGEPLVTRMIQLRDRLVAAAYNNAFTTTGADGVAIISDSHPLLDNTALYNDNLFTGSLTPSNIKNAKLQFNHIYDQAGEFFETAPTDILIHPDKTYYIIELLESNLMAMEVSNTKNSIQAYLPTRVITNKYLNPAPWFLLDKALKAGCVLQWQKKIQLKTWWENNNDVFRARARERYAVGFTAPGYGIMGSLGVDA